MSEILIRRLLTPAAPMQRVRESDADRYRGGLASSYVHRAHEAIVAAEALSGRSGQPVGHDLLLAALRRASEHVLKAARVALGLSATRERDLSLLVDGRPEDIARIPTGDLRTRLRTVVTISEADRLDPALTVRWIRQLHACMADAAELPSLPVRPRRATPR